MSRKVLSYVGFSGKFNLFHDLCVIFPKVQAKNCNRRILANNFSSSWENGAQFQFFSHVPTIKLIKNRKKQQIKNP
jgi:hypothetical protein